MGNVLLMEEMSKRLLRVSLKDKKHLLQWLEATGRRWLIFNSRDLVQALPFPDGIDDLMRIVACYREHRRNLPSGRYEVQLDPILGKKVQVPLTKGETLEIEEWDRLIRYGISVITELDPKWTLDNAPL